MVAPAGIASPLQRMPTVWLLPPASTSCKVGLERLRRPLEFSSASSDDRETRVSRIVVLATPAGATVSGGWSADWAVAGGAAATSAAERAAARLAKRTVRARRGRESANCGFAGC